MSSIDRIRITSFLPICAAGESGELGRAINLELKEAAEEATGEKPEYDLYRIWKEHLTPVGRNGKRLCCVVLCCVVLCVCR
jgi:hypothetical protein